MNIVVLSGPIASGKSTLARGLGVQFGALDVKTNALLRAHTRNPEPTRAELQRLGDKLDRDTEGAWVCSGLEKIIRKNREKLLIVDSVRRVEQIECIQKSYGRDVKHVHLTADESELAIRYSKRSKGSSLEFSNYAEASRNRTEKQVDQLAKVADIIIDTGKCDSQDVLIRVASRIGLYGRDCERLVDVLIGGQYGSEGKGQLAAYLAHEYPWLLRVGGPNAGHKVKEDPDEYTFHSLPSGTRVAPRSKLIIGPGATLYVPQLMKEIGECKVGIDRLYIDPMAVIIQEQDRKQEQLLVQTIGSTGQGVGVATANRILCRSNPEKIKFASADSELKPFIKDTLEILDDLFRRGERILLEGTQGTGLSILHGDYPHVTSRDTTVAGCISEAGISPSRVRKIVMVTRTYPIRVQSPKDGTSGKLKGELSLTEIANRSKIDLPELKKTETTSTTKKSRRIGEFDWKLLRKSASLNAPTDIALTFVDYLSAENQKAQRFDQLTSETIMFIEEVERVAMAPVSLISTKFHQRSIIDRRNW